MIINNKITYKISTFIHFKCMSCCHNHFQSHSFHIQNCSHWLVYCLHQLHQKNQLASPSYMHHWHPVAALNSFNHSSTSRVRVGGSGSPVESKWYHYIMVEADSHLKLLLASILDKQNVWAHWYAVHRHMVAAASNSHTTLLGSDLEILGHLSSQNPTWLRFGVLAHWWSLLYLRLMTRGVLLIAMSSADATASEYTWKWCALSGRLSVSSAVLLLKYDFFLLHPIPFLLRRGCFDMYTFFEGSWLSLKPGDWMAFTSLLWVLGASQTLSGESSFVLWELEMTTSPWGDGTTCCQAWVARTTSCPTGAGGARTAGSSAWGAGATGCAAMASKESNWLRHNG